MKRLPTIIVGQFSVKGVIFMDTGFEPLVKTSEIDAFVDENELAFLYVSQENCSVCHALKPQVKQVLDQYPNIATAQVRTDDVPEIAGKFDILTVPVLLLFVNGKEYHREARSVYLAKFDDKVKELYENYYAD